jgi:hypothetical protein
MESIYKNQRRLLQEEEMSGSAEDSAISIKRLVGMSAVMNHGNRDCLTQSRFPKMNVPIWAKGRIGIMVEDK